MENGTHLETEKMILPVLLCCSEADRERAKDFRLMLEKNGIPCEIPEKEEGSEPDLLDTLADLLECSCAVILLSEASEKNERLEMTVSQAIEENIPLAFVYLEPCSFSARPVDNEDQILFINAYHDDSKEIIVLLEHLHSILQNKISVSYGRESYGSKDVKKRISDLRSEYFCLPYSCGPSIVSFIIALVIAAVVWLVVRSHREEIIQFFIHCTDHPCLLPNVTGK